MICVLLFNVFSRISVYVYCMYDFHNKYKWSGKIGSILGTELSCADAAYPKMNEVVWNLADETQVYTINNRAENIPKRCNTRYRV